MTPLLVCALATQAHSRPLFSAPCQKLVAGYAPCSVVAGDFTGDGRPDLVAASYLAAVYLLVGNGDGTFQDAVGLNAGESPLQLEAADLNTDGSLDLIIRNSGVSVMLGNGDGTFQQARQVLASAGAITIADLDDDGRLDMAVSNGGITVLLGNGDGTFRPGNVFGAGYSTGEVAIADMNGDGLLDLITPDAAMEPGTEESMSAVLVMLGNGDGTFGAVTGFGSGYYPNAVAVADFDLDGRTDVVFANSEERSTTASVLLGNGDGTLGSQRSYYTGATPSSVKTEDLNGDGRPDVAVANLGSDPDFDSNTVSVLLSSPDGTLRPAGTWTVAENPTSLAIADFNMDRRPDIAAACMGFTLNGRIAVLLGNGDGTFGTTDTPTGSPPFSVAIGDLDGDGRQDLVSANVGTYPWYDGSVSVLLGNGNGTFRPRTDIAAGRYPVAVAIADWNGDGRVDLAVANRGAYPNTAAEVSVFLGNGDGTFGARKAFAVGADGAQPSSLAAADLNGDAWPDLAVTNDAASTVAILLGKGDGTFGTRTEYPTGGRANSVAIADLNRDGRPDLAVAGFNAPFVSVWLGGGDGTFEGRADYATGSGTLSVAIGDLDSDGRPDLCVGESPHGDGESAISVLLGNGDGTFRARTEYAAAEEPNSVGLADFDGDGDLDLAVVSSTLAGTVPVLLGNGEGTFSKPIRFGVGDTPKVLAIGDLDGNGRPDVAVANAQSGSVSILLNSSAAPTVAAFKPRARRGGGEFDLHPSFALDGFRPNPAFGVPVVAFTLADDSPAAIEVLDLAGRRVLRREVGALGAGRHVVALGANVHLAPGAYVVRLRQAGRSLTARGVVVH